TESQANRFLTGQSSVIQRPAENRAPATNGAADRQALQEILRREQQQREEAARLEASKAEATKLLNQIKPSQLEVNWDYALIERTNTNDLSTRLLPFNLAQALEGDPQQNLLLEKGDIVTIFSKEDIQIPASRKTKYVRLEGEFNHAGVYEIRPGETLRQLV